MKIEKIEINKLKPAAYNPRQINTKQYKDLKQSIEKFGLVDPIIINENGYVVIGGHQRLKICKELKHKEVGCVILELKQRTRKRIKYKTK
jgi:ParB-like chromosome segregation protein Spo0J